MGKIVSLYIKDELERKYIKLFLDILRSNLNKDQVRAVTDVAFKAMDKAGKPTKGESIDYAYEGKGFWGEVILAGWGIRDLGPLGTWLEGPNGERVYPDKSGDFEVYRAACEAAGIELKA